MKKDNGKILEVETVTGEQEKDYQKKLSKFGRRTFLALLAALTAEACLPEGGNADDLLEQRRIQRRRDSASWVREFPYISEWLREIAKEYRRSSFEGEVFFQRRNGR